MFTSVFNNHTMVTFPGLSNLACSLVPKGLTRNWRLTARKCSHARLAGLDLLMTNLKIRLK